MLQLNINNEVQFDIVSYRRDTCFDPNGHGSQAYIDFLPTDTTLNTLYQWTSVSNGRTEVHTLSIIYTDEENNTHTYTMTNLEAEITGMDEVWDGHDLHGHLIIVFAFNGKLKPQTNIFS